MSAPNILVGIALLVFGRRLFWLFVGAAGFIAGLVVSQELLSGVPDWLGLMLAVGAGVLGAVLSVFLQKFALAVAGFLTGGYVFMNLASALGHQSFAWPAFLIGGVLGAVSILILFDWALILLSALAGAILIAQSSGVAPPVSIAIFLVALIAGVAVQAGQLGKSAKQRDKNKS